MGGGMSQKDSFFRYLVRYVFIFRLRSRLEVFCENHAVLVPRLAVRLELYCANRAVLVPLLAVRLGMHIGPRL